MKATLFIIGSFVVPFSILAYYLIINLQVFKEYHEQNVDKCIHEFPNIYQPEHVQQYKNILLISSADRNHIVSKFWNLNQTEYDAQHFNEAGMYALYPPFNTLEDIKQKVPEKIQIINYPKHQKFLPLGFSFFEDVLFVINTSYDGDKIDEFKIIQHNETLKLKLIYKRSLLFGKQYAKTLNGIYTLSKNEFLVTKCSPLGHFESFGTFKTFVAWLQKQNVTFSLYCKITKQKLTCDIQEITASAFNNGIVKDKHDRIYIAHTINQKVSVYELEDFKNDKGDQRKKLEWIRDIQMPASPDNLNYDAENDIIYVAMVGKLSDFVKAMVILSLNNYTIPAQEDFNFWGLVGKINVEKNVYEMEFQQQFVMNNKLRGISGMERLGKYYFLGSFLDNKLLMCEA